ncbi:MAG: SPOR domain-containing protein, partial [Thiolinea sp.]
TQISAGSGQRIMTRDFKQHQTAEPGNQYGISWVLGGIAVGLLAGAVFYLVMTPQALQNLGLATDAPAAPPQQGETAVPPETLTDGNPSLQDAPPEDKRPGFSYHAVLPQLEVDIPIAAPTETPPDNLQALPEITELEAAQQESQPQATQTQAEPAQAQAVQGGRYMFQLGAYRNRQQAVQMQELARRNGMNTRVETAQINGQTWYRVRLGPTDNIQIVNRWKQRLSGMGINPMMIRL